MYVPLLVHVELGVSRFRFAPPHFRFQLLLVYQLLPRYLVLLLWCPPQWVPVSPLCRLILWFLILRSRFRYHSCDFVVMLHYCDFVVVVHSYTFVVVAFIFFLVCQCRILIVVYLRCMCRRLLYFSLHLPVHSCDIPVNFVECFVHFVIWQNIIYRRSGAVFKNQAFVLFFWPGPLPPHVMTIVGVGTSVNFRR